MIIRFIAVTAAAVSLAGCVSTPPSAQSTITPGTPVQLTAEQVAKVEAGVRGVLKDPLSAMFETPSASRSENGVITVCGFVNAKNSFGGYTGRKPYGGILAEGGFVVAGMGGTDSQTYAVSTVCARAGIPLV